MNEQTEYEFNSREILESLDAGDPYLRRNFIGASDAPIIMGVSPWRTPLELYREKLGITGPQAENEAMAEGKRLESLARKTYELLYGISSPAKRFFSSEYPWMMASLDGCSASCECVEIKCGISSHSLALKGEIAPYYIPQLQHQMYVAGIHYIWYFSYRSDDDCVILKCMRDDKYIAEMIKKEVEFWNMLQTHTEPEMTNKDITVRDDIGWSILCQEWKEIQRHKEDITIREIQVRDALIEMSGGKSSEGSGVKLTKVIRKGSINYSQIFELQNIDLEKYRKENIECWKISTKDEE